MAKKLPDFKSQEEEDAFWKTHDATEYINWNNAKSFVERVFKNKKYEDEILKDLKKKTK